MRQRILVVAKDMALRGRLARALKSGGYAVELAESPAHARRVGLRGFALSLVALDGLGPEAKSFLGELETNSAKPLLIGADGSDGFQFADDADLLTRVAEALKPVPGADAPAPVLRFDRYRLDIAGYALTDETGQAVPLTRGEFSLLREFVRRPGRVLSRDQLLNSLAGRDAESYDRSIDMLMVRLRRKIEADPKRPSLIVTIPGLGYKFTPKVAEAAIGEVGAESKPEAVTLVPSPLSAPERRQLTVVHISLSGPAFIAVRRDPEDLQRVLAVFHEHCAAVVSQAGGTIDRLLSDGVLVYFGYPQTDEHQAERAIRASLRLIETTGRIDTGHPGRVQIRIGVATGLALVGGPSGGSSALGEAASIAAGLAARAGPDAVLIAESTRRLVGGLFECHSHGPITLDDAAEPVEAWQVTDEGAAEGRFEALHGLALTPLVGREEELALLLRRWEQAKGGDGKVVLINGEPGIGKSRLTRGLQDAIAGQPHIELRFFCSPHHQDSALHPIIAQIEHAAGFARDDTDEVKLTKLDALLAQSDATDEAVALIAELLSITTDQRERIQQMTPRARRERTLAALLAQLTGLAARQPVLAIYEDLHWIDPSSRELLDRSVEQLERLPVLLLVTFRPEFQPPWAGQPSVTSLALNRLDRNDTAAMIAELAGEDGLSADITQEIAERTDGVPLFIEEVTKAAVESGPLATEALSSIPHPTLSVPATLHASLIARLDRLGPAARDIAQKGAAIGREFRYELIAAIANRPEPELREALERLTSAGLLFVRGIPPQSTYLFKHALVQDTAYGTLVRAARQQIHARIVATLEDRFTEIVVAQPTLLAQHYAEAGLVEKAVVYWLKAGQQALGRSADTEAVVQLRKGLDALARLPDDPWRLQQELDLLVALRPALSATKGFAAADVGETLARARALAEQIDRPEYLVPLSFGQWTFHLVRSEHRLALSVAEQLEKIGERRNDVWAQLQGRHARGTTRCFLGEFVAARALLEGCHDLSDPAHRATGGGLSEDPYAALLAHQAVTLASLGYIDQARSRLNEASSEARRLRHAHTLALVLLYANWTESITRSPEMQRRAEEFLALSTEHGFRFQLAWATACRGRSLTALGQARDGLALLTQGLVALRAAGAVINTPLLLMWLAEAYALLGQPGEGLKCLTEVAQIMEITEERANEAELHRLRGDLLLQTGGPVAAEASFQDAIAVAQHQEAKLFELRASTSLARLWRDQGKHGEARTLLAPVYTWFTEGFDLPDLQEAKALLDELRD